MTLQESITYLGISHVRYLLHNFDRNLENAISTAWINNDLALLRAYRQLRLYPRHEIEKYIPRAKVKGNNVNIRV